jgi:hypothetical protein
VFGKPYRVTQSGKFNSLSRKRCGENTGVVFSIIPKLPTEFV